MFKLLLLAIVWNTSAQSIHYVKPVDYSSNRCLSMNRSCLTIDQYTQQAMRYFTTGSTFVFLAGNHELHASINLKSISEVTFQKEETIEHCNIICKNEVTILCMNVSGLLIDGLRFQLHSKDINQSSSALKLYNSDETKLSHLGSRELTKNTAYFTGAIYSEDSVGTLIMNCIFELNTGHNGSAILSNGSSIELTGNAFVSNVAQYSGGAIYAYDSTLTLNDAAGNMFLYNSAQLFGGAISCINSILNIIVTNIPYSPERSMAMPNTTFFYRNRVISGYGGGIFLRDSITKFSGTIIEFKDNAAERGGGMYVFGQEEYCLGRSSVVSDTTQLKFTGNIAQYTLVVPYTLKTHC